MHLMLIRTVPDRDDDDVHLVMIVSAPVGDDEDEDCG